MKIKSKMKETLGTHTHARAAACYVQYCVLCMYYHSMYCVACNALTLTNTIAIYHFSFIYLYKKYLL